MGYTNYWYKLPEISQKVWDEFIDDFGKIVPLFVRYLESNTTDGQQLVFDNNEIRFNGIGENAHETFSMERKVDTNGRFTQYLNPESAVNAEEAPAHVFDFCKTARKPYDIAVVCALIIAKHHFKDDIKVSSDGDIDGEWIEGKEMCQDRLGYGKDFKLDEDE
jgi:hypothetical protein